MHSEPPYVIADEGLHLDEQQLLGVFWEVYPGGNLPERLKERRSRAGAAGVFAVVKDTESLSE